MNICKERLNNRTKSLREKFSRNRSYSELSFKDVSSSSTAAAAANVADVLPSTTSSNPLRNTFNLLSKKTGSSSAIISSQQQQQPTEPIIEYEQLQNESYGSALNLTTIPLQSTTVIGSSASGFDPSTASTTLINQIDRPFLWQHDVAIQCNLIQAPELLNVAKKLPGKKSSSSSTITHSSTTALINVAAAKLRNITDHHSYSDGLNQQSTNLMITQPEKLIKNENTSAGGGYVGRFWKSTMSVTFNSQQNHSGPTSPFPTLNSGKKSTFRWTTSVRRNKHQQQREQQQNRQPILKRAASFNDNSGTGYARLVQSTSSPSSPELIHDERNNNNNNRLNILDLKPKLIRPTALFNITNENNNNDGNNKKLMKIKSITTEALNSSSSSSQPTTLNRHCNNNRNKMINSAPDSFDDSTIDDDDDTETNIVILSPASEMNDNKIINQNQINNNNNNNNNQKRQKRNNNDRRKISKSSYHHYHDDNDYNYYDYNEQRNRSGDNELYNFDTKNRLLNISLEASSQQEQKMAMKPFLLDLPKTIGSNNNGCMGSNSGSSGGGGGLQVPDGSTAHSTYLNLPSPNIQSEIQDVNPVLRKLSVLSKQPELILQQQQQQQKKQQEQLQSGQLHNHHNYKYSNRSNDNSRKSGNSRKSCDKQIDDNDDYLLYNYDDQELMAPDEQPSVEELQRRRRRRALVPPKLITDGPSIDDDDAGSDKSITTSITNDNDNNDFGQQLSPINNQSSFIDNSISNKSKQSQRNSLPSFNVEITGCSNQSSIGIEQTSDVSISDHHSSGGGDNVHDDDNKCKSISPEISDHYYDDGRKSPRSDDHSSPPSSSSSNLLGVNLNSPSNNKNNRRRSSVVVIPPMQICPGDLLVYSKVLTQRANLIAECGGGGGFASSLLTDHDNRKSHKNTWSLLRLFDRSGSRSKADQILCGLEEFLSNLAPSNSFFDESMLRYRGISWYEFQSRLEKRRISNDCSSTTSSSAISLINALSLGQTTNQPNQQYHSRFIDNSRFSSLQSNTLDTIAVNCPLCHRTQTIMIPAIPQPVVPPSQPPPPPTTTGLLTTNMPKAASYSVDRLLIQPNDTNLINGTENQTKYEVQSAKYYQRTDSVSTEQEVESIVDFEIADNPTTTAVVDQQHQQQNLEPLQPSSNSKTQQPINSGFTMNSNDICGPGPAPEPSQFCRDCFQQFKREKRRREALWELFQSELLFLVDHLMVLKNVFMEPLKNIQVEGYAMFAEPEVLFGNLDELCLVTYAFCKEFLSLLIQQESSGDGIQVTNILNKLYLKNNRIASSTQAYHRYTLNYINALQYLETLRRHLEFIEFEKWCNRDPRCKKLQLTDLLVTPVQHVMRIPLLLKEIESKTYQSDEKRIIQSIIEQQEHSLRELDDKMRWLKNFERLLEIQRNILWPSVLDMDPKVFVPEFLKSFLQKQPCERLIVSPRRQIILEGPLMIMDSGKSIEMYVFLFDDLLLITRRKKGLGKKQSTLTDRWVTNCSGRSSSYSSVVGGSVGASNVVNPSASIAVATTMITGAVTNTNINNVITNVPGTGSISTAAAAAIAGAGTIVTSAAAAAAVTSGHHFTSGSLPGGSHHVITTTTASAGSITQTGINLMSLHGEPHHGPLTGGGGSISGGGGGGGGSSNNAACFKYVVYKQPLSLDRFYIHDVPGSDGSGSGSGSGGGSGSGSSSSNNSGLKNAFVLVCLNRFQQVITVHTFQASSESAKHTWLSKLRSTCDRWKRTLQSNQVFRSQKQSNTSGKNDTTAESQKSSSQRRQQQQQPKNDSEPSPPPKTTTTTTTSVHHQQPKNKRITEMVHHHHGHQHHQSQQQQQQQQPSRPSINFQENLNQKPITTTTTTATGTTTTTTTTIDDCGLKRMSIDSMNSVEASISYQIDDSQLTATTFT